MSIGCAGGGPGCAPIQRVVAPLEADATPAAPVQADQLDSLLERCQRLARAAHRSAHGADGVPERPGTKAQLYPAPAQHVKRGRRLGQHGRRAQRQVGHIREQPHPLGACGQGGQQRPGNQGATVVRVVLHRDEVQALHIGQPRDRRREGGVRRQRVAFRPELERRP
jgi:hypothetical protein